MRTASKTYIQIKRLHETVEDINILLGMPKVRFNPLTKKANIGCIYISHCPFGWNAYRVLNERGDNEPLLIREYPTKKITRGSLQQNLTAFLQGIRVAQTPSTQNTK